MQEKKKQYILDDLLRIILAMFVLTVLFAFSCLLLSHGARGIWLAVLAQFTLLGVLGGVFLRRCLRIRSKKRTGHAALCRRLYHRRHMPPEMLFQ